MRALERLIVSLTPLLGGMWVRSRRRLYRRTGRPLLEGELRALTGFYDAALLRRVRVAVVRTIDPSWVARVPGVARVAPMADLSTARGMAFGDAVVTTVRPPDFSLLFHEMVHVVQYEIFGIGPMLAGYVRDYFEQGRDYFAIGAERCAYDLQAKFDAAPADRFDVAAEVRCRMSPKLRV